MKLSNPSPSVSKAISSLDPCTKNLEIGFVGRINDFWGLGNIEELDKTRLRCRGASIGYMIDIALPSSTLNWETRGRHDPKC